MFRHPFVQCYLSNTTQNYYQFRHCLNMFELYCIDIHVFVAPLRPAPPRPAPPCPAPPQGDQRIVATALLARARRALERAGDPARRVARERKPSALGVLPQSLHMHFQCTKKTHPLRLRSSLILTWI